MKRLHFLKRKLKHFISSTTGSCYFNTEIPYNHHFPVVHFNSRKTAGDYFLLYELTKNRTPKNSIRLLLSNTAVVFLELGYLFTLEMQTTYLPSAYINTLVSLTCLGNIAE